MDVELRRLESHKSTSQQELASPEHAGSSNQATHQNVEQAQTTAEIEASRTTTKTAVENAADGPQQQPDAVPVMNKVQLISTFVALSVVGFLTNLDTFIVATAMPQIASEFGSLDQQAWIALSYMLTFTVFQPMAGRATDLFGSRAVLFASIFVFELGSLLCALAKTFIWLCCARAVAGLGGAGIFVVVMVIASQIVPLRDRGRYMGIMYARIAFATVIGPLVGGLIVAWDWRWCFWLNLVVAAPTVPLLLLVMKKLPAATKPGFSWRDLDYGGMIICGISVVSLCLAFNWGGVVYEWDSKVVIALLVVGFALVPIFVVWEIKVPSFPLIPMSMFRFRNVTTTSINNFFSASALQGVVFYLPSYYQIVRHDKQVISGLEVLPYIVPLLITSTISGIIISRTGSVHMVLWIGGFTNLAGIALLIMLDGKFPRAVEYVILVLTGLGGGFLMQASLLSAQSQVTRDLLATVTTMALWSRSLGAIIGVAMQGSIITNIFKRSILNNPAAAPYVAQLLASQNVTGLPADVQVVAARSYGMAFQMMMVATTAFCTPGFLVSLVAKKQKLS